MSGTRPQHISSPIDATWRGNMDLSAFEKAHGVYDPDERTISWWYVEDGDSECKRAITFDIDNGVWSTRTYRNEVQASLALADDGDGAAYVSSTDGYTWKLVGEALDGVDSGAAAVVEVDTGATTTVIPLTTTIQSDAVGVVAYIPSTGEERLITANTTTEITVGTAFSGAPAAGTEIWLGSIDVRAKTKNLVLENHGKARPSATVLEMEPGEATGRYELQYFLNNSATAETFTIDDAAFHESADGITVNSDSIYVDMDGGSGDGYAAAPMPSSWSRRFAFEVRHQKPIGTPRLKDIRLLVEERDDSGRMVRE